MNTTDRLDQDTIVDKGSHCGWIHRTRHDRQGAASHAGGAFEAGSHGGAGRCSTAPRPPRRHRVVHEPLQHSSLNQVDPTSGQALRIKRRRSVGTGVHGVIREREIANRNLFAHTVGKQRTALQYRLAVEGTAQDAKQRRRDIWVEHDRGRT